MQNSVCSSIGAFIRLSVRLRSFVQITEKLTFFGMTVRGFLQRNGRRRRFAMGAYQVKQNSTLPAINKKILSAEILKGEKIDFAQDNNGIKITLSEFALRNNAVDTVVKLTVE